MNIEIIKSIVGKSSMKKEDKTEVNRLLDSIRSKFTVLDVRLGDVFNMHTLGHPFVVAKMTEGGNYVCIALTSNADYEFVVNSLQSRIQSNKVGNSYLTTTLITASPDIIKKNFLYHCENIAQVQNTYARILKLITS